MKRIAYGACVLVVAIVAAAAAIWTMPAHERPAPPVRAIAEHKPSPPSPSLYCVFSDFTHASVVVGFDFAVALRKGGPPRFSEIAEAVRTDPAVDFDASDRPAWSYAVDDDGTPTITSPDHATRILLYGLKRDAANPLWIEAGIRSNDFRNLDGKCLQAHFDRP